MILIDLENHCRYHSHYQIFYSYLKVFYEKNYLFKQKADHTKIQS
jgi:hypothetical protein